MDNSVKFETGKSYRLYTAYCLAGFYFIPMTIGPEGMTGYLNGGHSWPVSVNYSEIDRVGEEAQS